MRYVALRPEASLALELAGIKYSTPARYTDGNSIHQDGLASFDEILTLCAHLDERLSTFHDSSLRPATYAFYHLKILWDVIFTTVSILQGIFRQEHPDLVRVYTAAGSIFSPYAFSNDESVYAAVLRLEGWPAEVEVIETTADANMHTLSPTADRSMTSRIMLKSQNLLKDRSALFNLALIARRRGIQALLPAVLQSATRLTDTPLILYENGFNWDDALPELYRNGFSRIIRIWDSSFGYQPSDMEQYRDAILETCWGTSTCRELALRGKVDTSPLLFEKLAWIVSRATAEALEAYPEMIQIIRDRRVGAVLLSTRMSAIGHALVQAAHDCEIPVVSWQHGGAGYSYHPMMPYIESINSDIHLVFGESVAAAYRETDKQLNLPRPPQIIAVGSSSLDRLIGADTSRLPEQAKQKTILYATTSYLNNQYNISIVDDPSTHDESLWSVQKAVLNLARAHPEHSFIVKLHPSHASQEPLKRYVEHHMIRNVRFVVKTPLLTDLLQEADVLLFDLISTGILQALQTDLPIFMYAGQRIVDDDALHLLQRRVFISDNVKEYSDTIDRYLSGNIDESTMNVHDDTFSTEFGTFRGDGRSAERAVEVIRKAIGIRQSCR